MANATAPDLETYSNKYQSADSAKDYERRIYAAGGGSEALWKIEQQVMDGLLARYCPQHAEAKALDFACGSGRILKYLQPRSKSLVGVDISAAMLELAREKVGDGVELICTDIVASPERVPGERDLVTAFRFLLLAEAPLRQACVNELAKKVRAPGGVMILNSHGNPWSFRAIASLRNRLMGRAALPNFSIADMRKLAYACGLRIIGMSGMGFVPGVLVRLLPGRLVNWIERILAGKPIIWRLGTNLFFVCQRKD